MWLITINELFRTLTASSCSRSNKCVLQGVRLNTHQRCREKKNKEEEKEQRTVSGRTPATTARRRNDGTSSSSSYLLGKREYKSPKATTMLQRTVGAGQRFKAVKSSFKFCSQNFSEMHMNLHNVKEMLSCKRSNAPVAGVSVLVTKHLKTSESGGRGGSGEKHKTCQLEHQRVAPSMCTNMWQQVVVAVPCHLDDQG